MWTEGVRNLQCSSEQLLYQRHPITICTQLPHTIESNSHWNPHTICSTQTITFPPIHTHTHTAKSAQLFSRFVRNSPGFTHCWTLIQPLSLLRHSLPLLLQHPSHVCLTRHSFPCGFTLLSQTLKDYFSKLESRNESVFVRNLMHHADTVFPKTGAMVSLFTLLFRLATKPAHLLPDR